MDFLQELKRRNVFRVGVAYVIAAWIALQFADMIFDNIGAPEWAFELVLTLLVVGLILAVFIAWAFEVTPEGIKRDSDVDRQKSVAPKTGRRIDRVIIGLLALAVIVLLWDKFFSEPSEPVGQVPVTEQEPAVIQPASYDSIGVLPFINISNDQEQDYFSDGIAEELLNALARINSLKVAARTSSFSLKGKDLDAIEIGNRLQVDTVLEGSIRKSGNQLRITAQLIDAANGYHLWSETYDREMTDIFAIQDEITAAIVEALKVHLEVGETVPATERGGESVEAYEKYLQAKHKMNLRDGSEREALELFRSATEIDPGFAAAWAGRAQSVINLRETAFWGDIPREEAHVLARNNIDRALSIDPGLAEAYVAQGMLFADEYRYKEALASVEKAVSINPSLAEAWTWRGRLLYRFGRIRESFNSLIRALEVDPLHPMTGFFAANLVTEYYDPEYFSKVLEATRHMESIQNDLIEFKKFRDMPFSAEAYREARDSQQVDPERWANSGLFYLKEFDESSLGQDDRYPKEFVMWRSISTNQLDKAEAIYQSLSEDRQQADINLEERSILLTMQGACQEAIDLLDRAHDGEIRIYGMVSPNWGRANSQLALNRAFCLMKLGREEEAQPILDDVRTYLDTLKENVEWGYAMLEVKLLILEGNTEAAADVLKAAIERDELAWFARNDPVIASVGDNPQIVAVFEALDRKIDALRADLGMPPATL